MENKFRVVSLFSGIGGFEHGLFDSKLNGYVTFASEIDEFARISYLANFPNHNLHGDITEISEDKIPDHDILMAGFPCQSFSIAGKQEGFNDTRGTLFFDILRIASFKKPKVLLLENVENLVNHDNSNTIQVILNSLSNIGYTVDFTIINSSKMGLPQNRNRTYIVAIYNQEVEKFQVDNNSLKINKLKQKLNLGEFKSFNFFNTIDYIESSSIIKDILESDVNDKFYFESEKINQYLNSYNLKHSTPERKIVKLLDLPKETLNDQERQRRVHSIYGISPTVLARSDTTKIIVRTDDGLKIRKLTPIENLRLQGFSEVFINNLKQTGMSNTQLYKQSGNAVSPPVVREIFNHLHKYLCIETIQASKPLTFIDLFSGLGGFRIALENNGCECVFSSEIDKYACETYRINFGEVPAGDICQIPSHRIPNHDILCAGFPCQPFSIAGKRLGFEDTRGTLFFEVARILRDKRPKAFILENVAGIVTHDDKKTHSTIINILEDLNYTVSWKLLNAKDFGVPQNRNRWYCIGVDKNRFGNVTLEKVFPNKIPLRRFLSDIISNSSFDEYRISDIAINNIEKHIDNYLSSVKFHSKQPIIANNIRPSKVSFSSNGISPCLTAKMGTGGNNVPVIYNQKRKLTTYECLQLMGFPKDYSIRHNYSQTYKQIGNSVVVPVIELLAKNLVKIIKDV